MILATPELINNKEIMLGALKVCELQKLMETALNPTTETIRMNASQRWSNFPKYTCVSHVHARRAGE